MKKQMLLITLISTVFYASCSNNTTTTKSKHESKIEEASSNVKNEEQSKKTNDKEVSKVANLLSDQEVLKQAEASLKVLPEFEGKKIMIFQNIHFYENGRIKVSIQNPDKAENIDEYNFENGNWQKPVPVQITEEGDMNKNVFPLDNIKFETVADIYAQLKCKIDELKIEDAKLPNHLYYVLNVRTQKGQWYSSIQGSREKYNGYFNDDGSLIKFDKN